MFNSGQLNLGQATDSDILTALQNLGTPGGNGSYNPLNLAAGNAAQLPTDISLMDKIFGYKSPDGIQHNGFGETALGVGNSLLNAFMGYQQLGIAKDQLSESKRQFDLNYGNQKTLVNSQLEDRQRARVASNPTGYQSVSSYMDKNGIK